MSDPDEPEGQEMHLVIPFIVCASHGGIYEDASYVAGVQTGKIDVMLQVAASVGASRVAIPFAVYTALVKQLELLGMHHGYPMMVAREVGETPEYAAMPQWSFVTFLAAGEEPEP